MTKRFAVTNKVQPTLQPRQRIRHFFLLLLRFTIRKIDTPIITMPESAIAASVCILVKFDN